MFALRLTSTVVQVRLFVAVYPNLFGEMLRAAWLLHSLSLCTVSSLWLGFKAPATAWCMLYVDRCCLFRPVSRRMLHGIFLTDIHSVKSPFLGYDPGGLACAAHCLFGCQTSSFSLRFFQHYSFRRHAGCNFPCSYSTALSLWGVVSDTARVPVAKSCIFESEECVREAALGAPLPPRIHESSVQLTESKAKNTTAG